MVNYGDENEKAVEESAQQLHNNHKNNDIAIVNKNGEIIQKMPSPDEEAIEMERIKKIQLELLSIQQSNQQREIQQPTYSNQQRLQSPTSKTEIINLETSEQTQKSQKDELAKQEDEELRKKQEMLLAKLKPIDDHFSNVNLQEENQDLKVRPSPTILCYEQCSESIWGQ